MTGEEWGNSDGHGTVWFGFEVVPEPYQDQEFKIKPPYAGNFETQTGIFQNISMGNVDR